MNELYTPIPANSFYYSDTFNSPGAFYNTIYALQMAIEQHWNGILFPNQPDLTKIIYGSNDFAFRKSASENNGILNIPFMNYYLKGITPDTRRFTWNNEANVRGLSADFVDSTTGVSYAQAIGTKLLWVPMHLEYEATVWYSQPQDLLYAFHRAGLDNTNETIITGNLYAPNNIQLQIPAVQYLNLEYNPEMQEQEWFEKNKIMSLVLDFEFDTWIVLPPDNRHPPENLEVFGFTQEVIFNFLSAKSLNTSNLLASEGVQLFTQYFT